MTRKTKQKTFNELRPEELTINNIKQEIKQQKPFSCEERYGSINVNAQELGTFDLTQEIQKHRTGYRLLEGFYRNNESK